MCSHYWKSNAKAVQKHTLRKIQEGRGDGSFQSSNNNYRVNLYSIDWNTGTATPKGPGYTIGSAPAMLNDLYAGDYGLYVTSSGAVGDTYIIDMNAAGPGGASFRESYTDTYS